MTSLPGHLTPYSRDAQYVVTLRKDDIPKHDCQKNNGNCSHVCLPSLITSFVSMQILYRRRNRVM